MSPFFRFSTLLLWAAPLHADIAWLDFQANETNAAPLYRAIPALAANPVTAGGITFTLEGSSIGSRDRGLADPVLTDFIFADGPEATLILRIEGLPAGTYAVSSYHYDGGGYAGAVQVEARQQATPAGGTVVLENFPFSTAPASYAFVTDGTPVELVFRENDGNDRLRINGLQLRAEGTVPGPPGTFIDIDADNTTAVNGSPSPFFTDDVNDPGFTSGALWRRRLGFGFNVTNHREIYEKDANGGVGDATPLVTRVSGLVPGQLYGVHIGFLSVPSEAWQVKGGLSAESLQLFTPTSPMGNIANIGSSSEAGSNRSQYLGFLGNAEAAADGTLELFADDGDGTATNWTTRTWLEGFLVGEPVVIPPLPGDSVEIAPDGAWTWFNDERSIVHQGSLYAGYITGTGDTGITRYDLTSGETFHTVISTANSRQLDDHNNPSLTVLPDGRLLALYSKHIAGAQFYQRTSLVPQPSSLADWGPEITIAMPAANTYANTYRLTGEDNAIYNFSRSINFNPTLTISTDNGATWGASRQLLGTGSGNTRPYPRYCSDGVNRIDLIYTDGHPRDVQNSVYHLYYQDGGLYKTDGTLIDSLANIPLNHDAGARGNVIYPFSNEAWGPDHGPDDWIPTGRGWTWDVAYGQGGAPVCVFQVQRDDASGNWQQDRIYYYYARWTGTEWQRRFIAQAGRPLYSAEDDYGGGMCLDPQDPRVVYISTNAAEPFALGDVNNVPLRSNERYEIYRGFTADGGLTFTWTPVTEESAADNLRPIVPPDHGHSELLVWFHGTYSTYTSFSSKVLARIGKPLVSFNAWAETHGVPAAASLDTDWDGVDNLLEYAFAGNPNDASDRPQPSWEQDAFAFPYPDDRSGIEWHIQHSENLADWETVAILRSGDLPEEVAPGYTVSYTDAGNRQAVVAPPSSPATPRRFLRVIVVPTN